MHSSKNIENMIKFYKESMNFIKKIAQANYKFKK